MAQKYGIPEQSTLLVLLVNGGEMPNADLRKSYGINLSPVGREKLNKAGLLKTHEERNRLFHKITSEGADWCEEALAEIEAPQRSGPLVRIGFEVLRLYIRKSGARLRDIIGAADEVADVEVLDDETLEDTIRRVYQELATKPQGWVRLAVLRPKLDGAGKDEVDQTLLTMVKTGLVHLSPDSDRRGLTDADHAAAIRIGKEDKHLVAIEES